MKEGAPTRITQYNALLLSRFAHLNPSPPISKRLKAIDLRDFPQKAASLCRGSAREEDTLRGN